MAASISSELCSGCETCIDICPSQAIILNDGKAVVERDKCVECSACVDACPSSAITLN